MRLQNFVLFVLWTLFSVSLAGELTFELPDNEKQCFFEEIDKGLECTLEFQVITGGHYDVDMELTAPNGKVLYKDVKKQYDSVTWTAEVKGIHKFCFSNEFSTFTHKVVYFDLEVGDEDPLSFKNDAQQTAMTLLETSAVNTHESLSEILDYQTHHKLREASGRVHAENLNERVLMWSIGQTVVLLLIGVGQMETAGQSVHDNLNDVLDDQTYFKLHEAQGRAFAEDLNHHVMLWSVSESIIVLLIGIGQVLVLRSFFTDKKSSGLHVPLLTAS